VEVWSRRKSPGRRACADGSPAINPNITRGARSPPRKATIIITQDRFVYDLLGEDRPNGKLFCRQTVLITPAIGPAAPSGDRAAILPRGELRLAAAPLLRPAAPKRPRTERRATYRTSNARKDKLTEQ